MLRMSAITAALAVAVNPSAYAQPITVLHAFQGGSDGSGGEGGLVKLGNLLYGVTHYGGPGGAGNVFAISTGGKETIIHQLDYAADGAGPSGGLTYVKGSFYGTASIGGPGNAGTVFSVSPSGTLTRLHAFGGGSDGAIPNAPLTEFRGALFGTTQSGGGTGCGGNGCGTFFRISANGTYKLIHRFNGMDGIAPAGSLFELGGLFYGVTEGGDGSSSTGNVVAISPAGSVTVLHSFGTGADGQFPTSGLTGLNGVLYGTTATGGAYGAGTAYSITVAGVETVLHSFGSGTDGAAPTGSLTVFNGALFGVTGEGGAAGSGEIYRLTKHGVETQYASFNNARDGSGAATLLAVGSLLYGVNYTGGGSGCNGLGCGTVFAYKPF